MVDANFLYDDQSVKRESGCVPYACCSTAVESFCVLTEVAGEPRAGAISTPAAMSEARPSSLHFMNVDIERKKVD